MERKYYAHISFAGLREKWLERARRTQFQIEIFRVRQKSRKQLVAFLNRQIVRAPFTGIARGDEDWRVQHRDPAFEVFGDLAKTIEPKFKKIRWLVHPKRELEIGRRRDHADEQLARSQSITTCRASFDRSLPCHIINVPRKEQ